MKRLIITCVITFFSLAIVAQTLSSEAKLAVNTISTLLPRMQMNEQYTQPIAPEAFAKVRGDWDAFNALHTEVVNA